jgi:hypothetical protein
LGAKDIKLKLALFLKDLLIKKLLACFNLKFVSVVHVAMWRWCRAASLLFFFLPNVPDHLLPLAFGTKACSAGDVPKVPKAWELGQSAR